MRGSVGTGEMGYGGERWNGVGWVEMEYGTAGRDRIVFSLYHREV